MATEAPAAPSAPPEITPSQAPSVDASAGANGIQKATKRSWRRKYRKMRLQFDNAMAESNNLIAQEWKAMGTTRRLKENNDQLLDALLDFNEQHRVNSRLRFDLQQFLAAGMDGHNLSASDSGNAIRAQQLMDDHAIGKITTEEYTRLADQLNNSQSTTRTLKSLGGLEAKVSYTTRADLVESPTNAIDITDSAPGYMTPAHEDEYLRALDQVLGEPGFDLAAQQGRPIRLPSAQLPLSEKDLSVRNTDSVYNWLRRHQPQVFLQDKDAAHPENLSEKSAAKPANVTGKKTKRESALGGGTPGPRDHDEEDLAAPDTSKGRRKTGGDPDDTAYRPKGGSSRSAKRKREEGDTPSGKGKKKSRASIGVAA